MPSLMFRYFLTVCAPSLRFYRYAGAMLRRAFRAVGCEDREQSEKPEYEANFIKPSVPPKGLSTSEAESSSVAPSGSILQTSAALRRMHYKATGRVHDVSDHVSVQREGVIKGDEERSRTSSSRTRSIPQRSILQTIAALRSVTRYKATGRVHDVSDCHVSVQREGVIKGDEERSRTSSSTTRSIPVSSLPSEETAPAADSAAKRKKEVGASPRLSQTDLRRLVRRLVRRVLPSWQLVRRRRSSGTPLQLPRRRLRLPSTQPARRPMMSSGALLVITRLLRSITPTPDLEANEAGKELGSPPNPSTPPAPTPITLEANEAGKELGSPPNPSTPPAPTPITLEANEAGKELGSPPNPSTPPAPTPVMLEANEAGKELGSPPPNPSTPPAPTPITLEANEAGKELGSPPNPSTPPAPTPITLEANEAGKELGSPPRNPPPEASKDKQSAAVSAPLPRKKGGPPPPAPPPPPKKDVKKKGGPPPPAPPPPPKNDGPPADNVSAMKPLEDFPSDVVRPVHRKEVVDLYQSLKQQALAAKGLSSGGASAAIGSATAAAPPCTADRRGDIAMEIIRNSPHAIKASLGFSSLFLPSFLPFHSNTPRLPPPLSPSSFPCSTFPEILQFYPDPHPFLILMSSLE